MLRSLKLTPARCKTYSYLPTIVQPMVAAAAEGADLEPLIRSVTQSLGFETFMYGICLDARPCAGARQFVFTTMPVEWVRRYDEYNYIDVDPRVRALSTAPLPVVWDRTTFRGESAKMDLFLRDASNHGLTSGISFPIGDTRGRPAIMALNSSIADWDEARLQQINSNFGDIMLFGQYFHELIMTGLLDKAIGPLNQGRALSPRERECLGFIARGLASEDISERMSITVRTVQMHVDSMRTKLGASNRQEAVALAIKRGIIVV